MPLSELFVSVFNLPPWSEEWEKRWAFDRLNIIFGSHGFCGFMAAIDQNPVGAIFSRLASYKGELELEVVELYVAASQQRKGVGEALIWETEKYAKESNITSMVLFTDKNTYARIFYSKLGFNAHPENLFMCKGIE